MSTNTKTRVIENSELDLDAVRERAYQIWEKEGRPSDRALLHWVQAEEEVLCALKISQKPERKRATKTSTTRKASPKRSTASSKTKVASSAVTN